MKLWAYITGLILLLQLSISAQLSNVQIGGPINAWAPEEPSICMNPLNPDELVIGANMDNAFYSTDGRLSWSDPVRVNDDPPGRHQFFNFMTIDQVTGKIYVIFYDRRNYTDTNTDVYVAVSEDGAQTFENYRISDTPFAPYSSVFFGHYIGIAAHNNHAYATWMRMDSGVLSLWGTPVEPYITGIAREELKPFSLCQNSPNPFQESTFFSFRLNNSCRVSLKVFDSLGNQIAGLIENEILTAGKHTIHFSPETYGLSSGIYYYSLITNQYVLTKKMILSE